jgi:hypothetical protein
VNIADSEQGGNIRFVGLCRERVSEKDYEVYLVVGNQRTDLKVSTEWNRI